MQKILRFLKKHFNELDPQTQRDVMLSFWKYSDLIGPTIELNVKSGLKLGQTLSRERTRKALRKKGPDIPESAL